MQTPVSGCAPAPPRPRLRSWLALLLYQFLFLCSLAAYLPVFCWRWLFDRRFRLSVPQRMGYVDVARSGRDLVWIHGVSVGEIKAATNIVARLRALAPQLQIVLSATTPNGHKVARQEHPDLQVVFYPLDFGRFPGRALDRVRPRCVLLMELEIWPNFLQAAARRDIPVAVINGRISERTFRGYRRARGLLPQLDLIAGFCVQDDAYRRRLLELGVDPARVVVTGNMKYDTVAMQASAGAGAGDGLRPWLAADGRLVVVAGSTHADEETWIAQALAAAGSRPQAVRLVLVPRHPERAESVCEAMRVIGREPVRWSETVGGRRPLPGAAVLVVDTIGQLQRFYRACDLAFVGGSLVPHGGQNMLEPAALGCAVLFGPHTFNFRTDVELLLGAGAVVRVQDRQQLAARLRELLAAPEQRRELGARARRVIAENQGATLRTLLHVATLLGIDPGKLAAPAAADGGLRPAAPGPAAGSA
jgi:3-deoxy-D-manno-octulosonic-acid transferase